MLCELAHRVRQTERERERNYDDEKRGTRNIDKTNSYNSVSNGHVPFDTRWNRRNKTTTTAQPNNSRREFNEKAAPQKLIKPNHCAYAIQW